MTVENPELRITATINGFSVLNMTGDQERAVLHLVPNSHDGDERCEELLAQSIKDHDVVSMTGGQLDDENIVKVITDEVNMMMTVLWLSEQKTKLSAILTPMTPHVELIDIEWSGGYVMLTEDEVDVAIKSERAKFSGIKRRVAFMNRMRHTQPR